MNRCPRCQRSDGRFGGRAARPRQAGAGRRDAGGVWGRRRSRALVTRPLLGAEVAGPGPARLPALRPAGRAQLPQAQSGPVRLARPLRGPRAEHAWLPWGGREGGRARAWRRRGQRDRAPPPPQRSPAPHGPGRGGAGNHGCRRAAARGAGVPAPLTRHRPISPPASRHRSPPEPHAELRPIGPRRSPRCPSRRGQSAAATAALQQGGASRAPVRSRPGRGTAGAGSAAAMEGPLSLLVRSPTQRHPDLRLRAAPAWTVRRLKAELRRLLPEAPPEEDQKLIYSGKLLLDHLYLRELLPKHGELHALHLVYNFKTPANVQETRAEVKADQPKLSSEASQEPSISSLNGERLRCSSSGQSSAEA
ncbi:LOW QUALITY PROTEIN: uncharacterized protein FYN16_005475, partial [Cariama cristata]